MKNRHMKAAGLTKAALLKQVREAFASILAGEDTAYSTALVIAHLNLAHGVTDGVIAEREISDGIVTLSNRISRLQELPYCEVRQAEVEHLGQQKAHLESLQHVIVYN